MRFRLSIQGRPVTVRDIISEQLHRQIVILFLELTSSKACHIDSLSNNNNVCNYIFLPLLL